jgi:thiol-disulfide isomerase/thioredoxin
MLAHRITGVACALGVLVAAGGCSTSGATATKDGFAAGDGSIRLIAAADRETAPDLSGRLVGGGRGTLRDSAGKVVVLNIWAFWCGPCTSEAPDLVRAARSLSDVTFMGINTRDNEANAEAFVRAHHLPYSSFYDQDGELVLALGRVVAVVAMPTTIILDRQRRVAAVIYGATTATTIEAIAKPLERES